MYHKCGIYHCKSMIPINTVYCSDHQAFTITLPRGSSTQRGYNYRWRQARKRFLSHQSLCVHCLDAGRTSLATEVDHIIPTTKDNPLFWDVTNWQALCNSCHSVKTARYDKHRRKQNNMPKLDGNRPPLSHKNI